MSTDYYMGCGKCMQCILVAQDGLSGFAFYSGEPDCMHEFGQWLEEHALCNAIMFLPEHKVDDMDERIWCPKHLLPKT